MCFPVAGVFKVRIGEGALRELGESIGPMLSEELVQRSGALAGGREMGYGDDGAFTFEGHTKSIDLAEEGSAGPGVGVGGEPYRATTPGNLLKIIDQGPVVVPLPSVAEAGRR